MKYCLLLFLLLLEIGIPNRVGDTFKVSPTLTTADHEFHLSKCEIAFNEEEEALQITLHLFIDDLEAALAANGIENLYICTDKEHEEAEQHIANYLEQTLVLQVNGEPTSYTFLGKEVSEDLQAVWCYLEVENIETLQELTVKNQVLISQFEDQKNVVSISSAAEGRKGYLLFDKAHFEDVVKF